MVVLLNAVFFTYYWSAKHLPKPSFVKARDELPIIIYYTPRFFFFFFSNNI